MSRDRSRQARVSHGCEPSTSGLLLVHSPTSQLASAATGLDWRSGWTPGRVARLKRLSGAERCDSPRVHPGADGRGQGRDDPRSCLSSPARRDGESPEAGWGCGSSVCGKGVDTESRQRGCSRPRRPPGNQGRRGRRLRGGDGPWTPAKRASGGGRSTSLSGTRARPEPAPAPAGERRRRRRHLRCHRRGPAPPVPPWAPRRGGTWTRRDGVSPSRIHRDLARTPGTRSGEGGSWSFLGFVRLWGVTRGPLCLEVRNRFQCSPGRRPG